VNTIIAWFFVLYFVILYAERLQSIVRILKDPNQKLLQDGFHTYVNLITMLSLASGIVLLVCFNGTLWKALFNPGIIIQYPILIITMGVVLVSGMVHTEYTIAPVQFGAYGMLIVAMVLRTVQNSAGEGRLFALWYSMIFLVVFSMAIPVMYESRIRQHVLFHIIEAGTALLLVCAFTYMMYLLFCGPAADLLLWYPVAIAVVLDAILIAMRWKEEKNTFVLMFVIATAVIFAVGRILFILI